MSFPLEKYTYVYVDNKVIAMSTYAGRIVKGVAKCNPSDEYDVQKGRELAAARCNAKIARKRMLRATEKLNKAYIDYEKMANYFRDMNHYLNDAKKAYNLAIYDLNELEEQL